MPILMGCDLIGKIGSFRYLKLSLGGYAHDDGGAGAIGGAFNKQGRKNSFPFKADTGIREQAVFGYG